MDHHRVRSPSLDRPVTLVALLAAAALTACGGESPTEPPGGNGGGEAVATVEVTPSADTLTAVGETSELSARALDADGDEVSGVSFTWSTSDDAVVTVDDQGVAEAVANGTAQITASADGVSGSADLAVLQRVSGVSVSPASATLTSAGATQAFSATATDENGNEVSGAAVVWQSEDHEVATVDENGVATAKASGTITVTATVQDVPGHAELTVNQAIDRLAFRAQPTDVTAGVALDPAVQVEVLDAQGRVVEDAEVAITLGIADDPAGGTLTGTTTVNAVNGVVSFSGLWIDAAAPGYTLAATSTGIPADTSAAFQVLPAAPVRLAYEVVPENVVAGEPLGVQVAVLDEFGNIVTSAAEPVGLDLAQKPDGGSLVGTRQEAPVDGVATFDAVTLETAGTYRLTAFASGFDPIDSGQTVIVPAAAHHVGGPTTTFLPGGEVEEVLDNLQFTVRDTFGNVVFSSTAPITVALGSGGFPGVELSGTLTESASSGVATFDSVTLDKPGRYELVGSAPGLEDGTMTAASLLLPYTRLSAGGQHTCITTGRGPYCWGANDSGQLGEATAAPSGDSVAVAAGTDLEFVTVRAGDDHTCGVTAGGDAHCWGSNADGQLGDGNAGADRTAPAPVAGAIDFESVAAGGSHSCGVASPSGHVYCWGANDQGQLGTGGTGGGSDVPVLVTDTLDFQLVVAGDAHTCGWGADGLAYCWGDNADGQLGDGNLGVDSPSPVQVQLGAGDAIGWLSAGARHTCAIRLLGADAACWGANDLGQLNSPGGDSDVPVSVVGGVSAVHPDGSVAFQIASGDGHSCLIQGPRFGIYCWGDNSSGQRGDGTTGGPADFALVSGSNEFRFVWVAAGRSHTCALAVDEETLLDPTEDGFFCWGANANGQLGDGTTAPSNTMSRVIQGY